MNEIIKVSYKNDRPTVSARELHEFLEIGTQYSIWLERMKSYGFTEHVDYEAINQKRLTAQGNETEYVDHQITIEMGKEIAMIQRTDKGKLIRTYFINLEKAWNTPEMVMARALKMADGKIKLLENKIEVLTPKAELADHLFESKDTIDMLEMSKVACKNGIKIGRTNLFKFLRYHEILMGDNQPYQRYIDWFEVVEQIYNTGYTTKIGFKPLVTPKGQAGIIRLLKKEYGSYNAE